MPVAERRLGLRRLGLRRRASGPRDARGPRRADRRGGPARHPRPARPRPEPHERPAPVVPGRARRATRAPRLLRLGRPGAGRLAAEQLAARFGGAGVDARRADRPVLPAQLPADAARPELVERGACATRSTTILRFWFDRGVAGFRIDVGHALDQGRASCATTRRRRRTATRWSRRRGQAASTT